MKGFEQLNVTSTTNAYQLSAYDQTFSNREDCTSRFFKSVGPIEHNGTEDI